MNQINSKRGEEANELFGTVVREGHVKGIAVIGMTAIRTAKPEHLESASPSSQLGLCMCLEEILSPVVHWLANVRREGWIERKRKGPL